LTVLMRWITIHRMVFTSALFVLVTAVTILLVGCGDGATITPPLPTLIPAATATPISSTLEATVLAPTATTALAASALPTLQPPLSQTPTLELQPLSAEALDRFAAYVEENRELYKVPGTAVVVVQGGEVVFAQGFGVKEAGGADPVTPDTVFSIGSLTKPMTSMMAATLVDEGLMDWDTPVVEIMPQFQLSDADAAGQITLRHLFSHTTGLPNTDLALLFAGLPPEGLIEFLKGVPLDSQPGESRTYQNEAYVVGAYVAAMAFGGGYGNNLLETYIDLMKSRVFDPIGMSTATFSAEEAEASPNHATPHYSTINGTLAETGFDITPTHYWDIGAVAPAGSVGASAMDVGSFLMTMLAEGLASNGTRVVSGENLAETWSQQIEINAEPFLEGAGAALGWRLADYQGITVITHNGVLGGFSADMAFVPGADTGIVVLSNIDTLGLALGRNVQYRLVEMLYGLEPRVAEIAKSEFARIPSLSELYDRLLPVDPESVAPYLGEYETVGNPYTIEWRDGGLWFSQGSLDIVQLLAAPDGVYVAISPGFLFMLPFQFVENEDGSITLIIAGKIEAPKLGTAAAN